MNHDKYKELLELNVLGELSKEEELELENHLFECEECSIEYAEIKKLHTVISTEIPQMPSEANLLNARKRLFNTINAEKNKPIYQEKKNTVWQNIFSNKLSLGFGSIALILVGFFIGFILFNKPNEVLLTDNSIDLDKIDRGEVRISKVNFPARFSEKGEFEIKLDGEKIQSYIGNLNDVVIQKLLASAIQETNNPGFKIKTAKLFSELLPENFTPDKKIQDAFINSLKTDNNPGVRKEALQALINFSYDDEVRDALLYVLENDDNASNRIDAINTLLSMNLSDSINDSVKNNLNQKIVNEDNELIKFRTAKLLIGGNKNEK